MFVSPSTPDDPFFSRVELFTRLAAKNLDMQLSIVYGEAHRIYQHEVLKKLLAEQQPDYLLVQVFSGSGKALFDLLKDYPQTKVISLEHLLLNHETEIVGKPGEIYKNWISELTFDNQSASELLSRYLLQACEAQAKLGRNGIVGVNGLHGQEALQRQAGLVEAADRLPEFELHQVVNAKWLREVAQQSVRSLLGRYPKTSVIWSASDWMALGAIDAILPLLENGQTFCVGGFDWLPSVVDAVEKQKITASIGGHFMLGAWAMVMVYDHARGALPQGKNGTNPTLNLELMHAGNVRQIAPLLEPEAWEKVDFRRYSLYHNPGTQRVRFSYTSAAE